MYLIIILVILIGNYIVELIVESLNLSHATGTLPQEFEEFYDAPKYKKSQSYLRENTHFELLNNGVFTSIVIVFILAGGFNLVDNFARSFGLNSILTGVIFAGVLILFLEFLKIPFSAYHTFVIEEKYGFNKTTLKTFLFDILKSWMLGALIGGMVFAGIIWFFERFGAIAWLYSWVAVTLFQIFLMFVAPVVIMPLFNKFEPLEDGELKNSIEQYAKSENFKLKGIFKTDGSRRSTKSNAYFTGFGKYRRIVLFDTLIAAHTVEELVSVLAHEMGHYKKRHILKYIIISVVSTGLMFLALSFFMNNQGLFSVFKMEQVSVYASLLFFGFLYSPINIVISIISNVLSRKYEYESDNYAVSTYGRADAMISALKKLSVNNLSNLTPHPLKVFLEYSHPPVLERIKAIRSVISGKR